MKVLKEYPKARKIIQAQHLVPTYPSYMQFGKISKKPYFFIEYEDSNLNINTQHCLLLGSLSKQLKKMVEEKFDFCIDCILKEKCMQNYPMNLMGHYGIDTQIKCLIKERRNEDEN